MSQDFYIKTFIDLYVRLDFRRLPGPVFDPPRRDECGMSVGSFSRTAAGNRAYLYVLLFFVLRIVSKGKRK